MNALEEPSLPSQATTALVVLAKKVHIALVADPYLVFQALMPQFRASENVTHAHLAPIAQLQAP